MQVRFCLVSGSSPQNWRRRIRPVPGAAIFGFIGENASEASKRFSGLLSEAGMSNRWISLRRRPYLVEHTLRESSWHNTPLYALQREVPLLVLDAEPTQLRHLWNYLYAHGLTERLYFFPSHSVPTPLQAERLQDLIAWAEADESLEEDLKLAAQWIPCTIIPTLV